MRMRTRKLCGGKLLAFVLAFALVLPFAGGVQVQAAEEEQPLFTLTAAEGASTSLEIGDTVTLQLKIAAEQSEVTSIVGTLYYDTAVFETLTSSNIVSEKDGFDIGWDKDSKKLSITHAALNGGIKLANGDLLATITLTVKKAADTSTAFTFTGAKVSCFNKENEAVTSEDVSLTVSNSKSGTRTFSMTVPASATVYTNVADTSKYAIVELPVKVIKNATYNGYNAFKLSFRFDPYLLSFQGAELSDKAKAYTELHVSNTSTNGDGTVTVSISVLATENMNVFGDFVFLKFMKGATATLNTSDTEIKFELSQVTNESLTDMTYGIGQEGATTPVQTKSTTTKISFAERSIVLGDINDDGQVDLLDATMGLQYYNGARTLTDDQLERADVNQSGTVTLVDVLLIMRFYNEGKTDWSGWF